MKRGTLALAVAVVLSGGLAACSGGADTPKVASLNGAGASATTTTLPSGTPVQLVDDWANCIRTHGIPNQTDPVISASGGIQITLPNNTMSTYQSISSDCQAYLTAASHKLNGGKTPSPPNPGKLLAYSHCMQQNGVPDFPDPTANGLQIKVSPGSDLNPSSPVFQAAEKTCAKKTGVPALGANPSDAPAGSVSISAGSGPGPGTAGGPGAGGASSGMVINGSGSGGQSGAGSQG